MNEVEKNGGNLWLALITGLQEDKNNDSTTKNCTQQLVAAMVYTHRVTLYVK